MAEGIQAPAAAATVELSGRNVHLVLPLGFGRAVPTQGGPVYGEAGRPQRKPLTTYEGSSLVKLDVPVLLDSTRDGARAPRGLGLAYREDVWPIVERIYGLTRPKSLGEIPPDFTVKGPIPFSGLRCQMEWPELSTEPEAWVLGDGRTIRQALTLKLVEFINPDPLKISSGQQHNEGTGPIGGGVPVKVEVLKVGETLVQIAARVYGNPGRAKEIGQVNGIRDVREKLDRGRILGLPSSEG